MSLGFTLAENLHIVNIIPATPGSHADMQSDYINMKNASHVDFIISFGTSAGTATVFVQEACTAAGATATNLAFNYYAETTDSGDVLEGPTAATAAGGLTCGGNDKTMYVVSVDAAQMAETKKFLTLILHNSAANASCAMAVLSGCRYVSAGSATVLT